MTNRDDEYRLDVLPEDIREIMHDWYHTRGDEKKLAHARLQALDRTSAIERVKGILYHSDWEARCLAVRVLLLIDPIQTTELIFPLLNDPDENLGYCAICHLMDFACLDERATEPLLKVLSNHTNDGVRTVAAFLLGVIKDPRAIPALEWAVENDFGKDYEGNTVSILAQEALEKIRSSSTHL